MLRITDDALYHYTSFAAMKEILTSGEIFATNIAYLNDASEFAAAVDCILEAVDILVSNGEIPNLPAAPTFLDALTSFIRGALSDDTFVTSLSENGNQLSQWRAYCPNGGVSIGFDIPELCDWLEATHDNLALLECTYDRERFGDDVGHLVRDSVKALNGLPAAAGAVAARAKECGKQLLEWVPQLKDGAFREESEQRLVLLKPTSPDDPCKLRATDRMLIPYHTIRLPLNKPSGLISRIFIGPSDHSALAKTATERFLAQIGIDAEVLVSDIPLRQVR